ncbi:Hsp20/alpha crystallin family protein [Bacillus badius]|uniref:Spore coat protein n=1 Tax=Bacillus badius TaxID=1455 RepID=A0ABR5B028_BACBA|nr:Hsp20/alpha crystallin family protein [Bacillus badius]KIL80321.1 hypothetical protein SD77_0169 [Bacillus badius]MED4716910.1 Hsp20/alpha crystallin family protein [Bacillus badius]
MFPFQSPFPLMNDWQKWMKHVNEQEVEKYVQNILSSSLPSTWQTNGEPVDFLRKQAADDTPSSSPEETFSLQETVFETHEAVYVRVPVSNPGIFNELKIFHTSNQLILEGLPAPDSKRVIVLPAIVKRKGAAAQHKDGVLQIMIPKEIDFQYTEIDVRHLD